MSQEHAKLSRKRSAAEVLRHDTVLFPHAAFADFVVHYRGTAFHVHKLALIHHSSYFRAYIEQLTAEERATDECVAHTDIAHCIVLPHDCDGIDASVDDFRLFLCQLYFAAQYSCFPFHSAVGVDIDAQPAPAISLSCPTLGSFSALKAASSSEFDTATPLAVHEVVMSLCRHFDCALVLSRAEDNMLLTMESADNEPNCSDEEWCALSSCLLLSLQFDLRRVRDDCIPLLALHCVIGSSRRREWKALRAQLDADTLLELMLAAFDTAGDSDDGYDGD